MSMVQSHSSWTCTGSQGSGSVAARSAMVVSLVGDLSKIAVEFADHRNALFSKLSDLLRERYEFHAKRWLSTPHAELPDIQLPWEAKDQSSSEPEIPSHEALDGLSKDVLSMYRVLLKNLNGDSVRRIFAKAFEEIAERFEQRLTQELLAPTPPYFDRPGCSLGDRLAMDLAYLHRELQKLSGITAPLQRLFADMLQHLRSAFLEEELPKALHPAVLEAVSLMLASP